MSTFTERAKKAIDRVYEDTGVPLEETRSRLRELRGYVVELIEAIEENMGWLRVTEGGK